MDDSKRCWSYAEEIDHQKYVIYRAETLIKYYQAQIVSAKEILAEAEKAADANFRKHLAKIDFSQIEEF